MAGEIEMPSRKKTSTTIQRAIAESGLNIDDPIEIGSDLWIPSPQLESLLDKALRGLVLQGLPLRSRSKLVKQRVCEALGYPVPSSFRRSRPRFFGQYFDIYTQKSNNLQIWNDALAPTRRYVIVHVTENDVVDRVKVVTGEDLSLLDTTGTLTGKYQARLSIGEEISELIAVVDTANLPLGGKQAVVGNASPVDPPSVQTLIPIGTLYDLLVPLVGMRFTDPGEDQERNRAAELHRLVCRALGYSDYRDDGRFPDVRHQLLEVKLQTSPTIDLGIALPSSTDPLDLPHVEGHQLRYCDVRYLIVAAEIRNGMVEITRLYLTTGEKFFIRFRQFQGNVLNRKLQIRLPASFFD
jgi:hypothetical protein